MPRSRSARELEEWRREVALFRYTLVREPADASLSSRERGRLVRELAAREHTGPDGRPIRVARTTLDDWIRAYRAGGYEALVPEPRKVAPRTPGRIIELAIALKRERPDRTAAQIHAIMAAAGEPVPCARTLQTHLSRAGLNQRADGRSPSRVYGRFEAAAPNELWTGDGLHGPKLAATGRRAVLLAFIDDHSRLLVGWRWVTGEDVFGLEAALRPALLARGVPEAVLVDRGSAFVSSQLLRACAVLGAKLIHASPRAATTKGKIERFFRTCRDRFLVELDHRDDLDLSELNRLFGAWLEVVYHRRVHSETGQTYTGVRVSELVRIRTADVDLDSCRIRINQGKGAKDRYVPFPAAFKETLALHIDAQQRIGASHLFESSWKKPYSDRGVRKLLARYATAAGITRPISPHRLRHFLFTWLKTQGIDDALIQPYSRPRDPPIARDLLPNRADRRTERLQRRDHQLPRLIRRLVCGW